MFPSTPKMMRPPKITPSRMALEMFTGAGGWVQLELSEAFPEKNTMVSAGPGEVRLWRATPGRGRRRERGSRESNGLGWGKPCPRGLAGGDGERADG